MKKVTAFLMALMLAFSLQMAIGEEVIELDRLTMTGTTTVSLEVNSARDTYIVIIPSRVEIDPVTQYGEGTITLKSGWSLISVNGLDVRLTAAENGVKSQPPQYDITHSFNQNFTMKSASGESVTYAIKPEYCNPGPVRGLSAYSDSTCTPYDQLSLIWVNKGEDNTSDLSCTLTFYVKTMPPAGVYTDTLTFSIITR